MTPEEMALVRKKLGILIPSCYGCRWTKEGKLCQYPEYVAGKRPGGFCTLNNRAYWEPKQCSTA